VNAYIKAALALTAGLVLTGANFAIAIAGHPQTNLLMRGIGISTAIGIVIGTVPFVSNRRTLSGRGSLDVLLTAGLLGSALMLLYFQQLRGLYRETAFHTTLAIGWVTGALLVLSYAYARRAGAERNQH
jgi:hypothetical protein